MVNLSTFLFFYMQILTLDGTQIGQISKHWNGLFADARSFGIIFPVDLDAKLKALLLGTCCLVVRNMFGKKLETLYLFPKIKISSFQDRMFFENDD